mmetsp:Transcript_105383/g.183281  ORF Transcript_105383/g.183281 Transcript_105383/m.183281 type:complete len:395 (+) Transcript_105383:131-1315(+)
MAPKADKSKQAVKEKIAVDKTFGLKNKNKSKVVQKYIKSIVSNSRGESKKQDDADRKEKAAKQDAAQKAALMNSLFNLSTDKKGRAYDAAAKKKAKQAEEEAAAAGKKLKEEHRKAVIEGLANSIRLTNNGKGIRMSDLGGHPIVKALKDTYADVFKTLQILLFIKANENIFWVDDPENNNPMIRMKEDVDAEVAPDERPIEEIIEERRAALDPTKLTPVTPETFKAWKERKEQERLAKVEEERQEAVKKGGKSTAALSGRDLFTYDASLFQDDADAVSADEYDEREETLEDQAPAEKGDDDEEEKDEEEDEEEEEAAEEKGDGGARGSSEAPGRDEDAAAAEGAAEEVAINKELFLEGGDDLDDLDDLDDDDDGGGEEKKAGGDLAFDPPART